MSYFEKNLKALEEKQPELVELMRETRDNSHIEILTSEAGIPTARVTTHQGAKVILHDLKDPVARAQEHVQKLQLTGNNGSVLLGFGLGYLALEMVKAMENGHLLIIDPGTYASLEKKAQETALTLQINANTILYGGREMAGNILANTPEIIRSAGVKRLFDRFKNIPAIVVGAGPSLDKNVTLLREIKDKAVIIPVDRALGLLLPLGITPHLVPSIDYQKKNYDGKYAPLQMDEKLFMVFAQTLYHKITTTFWGPKFTMHQSDNLSSALSYYWGDKGSVSSGMHVGHLAFCMARNIGCNPIILVGMDLAFTGNKLHAEDIETNVPISPSEQYASEDIFGNRVDSDPAFKSFVIELNTEIKKTDALCIDATEGGARKEGTTIMRLRDAIDEYCQDDYPEIRSILEEESTKTDPAKYDELLRDLKFAEEEPKEMKKASQSTLKIIKKLRKMKKDGQERSPEYIKLSHKAEKMTIKAGGKGRIINLLENYNFLNTLFMGKDETKRIDAIEDKFEKLDKQLDRAETYYRNFIKALKPFIQDIQRLSKRLTVDRNAKDALEKSPKNWGDYLKYGLELIKTENYTDAEAAFKKVIELKPDHSDAHYYLGKIYSEQNRFKIAISILKQSIVLEDNSTRARNLLKKCRDRNQ
ncbi:MAG: DUF115 domain-containing protein, partial [Deltaproteobacteria bacterium]|nr:DUF115 domain-containing protein [Deltaproteobacteria bacterium]